MNLRRFFAELKRRNVYKVAIAYGVVAWLLMQVASQIFPFFEIPNWAVRLVVLLLVIGFPVAVILAWAFELTPEGIKRAEGAGELPKKSGRSHAWIYVVVIGGLISLGLFFLGRYTARTSKAESSELPAKSIAILPFENLSEEKGNAYFVEGIQDEILARLAKIAGLKVISRTSAQKYKSAPDNLREIAKQLGVANILEGSVQRAADQVRVTVQLINATTDAHLWADTYESTPKPHQRLDRRFDVVVHAEEVRRVVLVLQSDEAVVIRTIGFTGVRISFVLQVIDIDACDHERSHGVPEVARPFNVLCGVGRIFPA